ncbi:hypothetical protein [Lichenibacterium dinghuense]|uniref:hypothetical protein n=1 Tax=Lichenibacterium dinghuense TaxID=2895977 RepID=UPI001F393126|nr:hypothetical protein [Lichenibacterium sp. 6Y81]
MRLTHAEQILIDILREKAEGGLTVTLTILPEGCTVTAATPADGVRLGAGPSVEAALRNLCGMDAPADALGSAPSPAQH